jgi:hypothetical protein
MALITLSIKMYDSIWVTMVFTIYMENPSGLKLC